MQRLCGITPWWHPWLAPGKPKALQYLQHPDFEVWKNDPQLALISYVLIQHHFGWPCIASCMTACHELLEKDASDQEKMDCWVRSLSHCCGVNLTRYYGEWGIPLSQTVLEDASLLALPIWGSPVSGISAWTEEPPDTTHN